MWAAVCFCFVVLSLKMGYKSFLICSLKLIKKTNIRLVFNGNKNNRTFCLIPYSKNEQNYMK